MSDLADEILRTMQTHISDPDQRRVIIRALQSVKDRSFADLWKRVEARANARESIQRMVRSAP